MPVKKKATAKAATKKKKETLVITPPNFKRVTVQAVGTTPYVQHRFSAKAKAEILAKQMAGGTARGKKKIEPRDIEEEYREAQHKGPEGQNGIPASAIRNACISACRVVGFAMTKAKLSIVCVEDFYDPVDGTPLIAIYGEPEMHKGAVRLESGVTSVAIRPMWREWHANITIQYDADQFTAMDVINLLARAGLQVGIGEGRMDSKKSNGCGWGSFMIESAAGVKAEAA